MNYPDIDLRIFHARNGVCLCFYGPHVTLEMLFATVMQIAG